jgi:cytochrome P450
LCLFGQDIGCLEGPESSMIQAMDDATLESLKRPNRPKFVTWLLFQGKFAKETKTMCDLAANIVAKTREDKDPRKDMLHTLLEGKEPETGKAFTESQIIDEVITLFIGATTALCLVSFAVYYLLKNPQQIEKARKEIVEVVGSGPLELAHLEASIL